MIGKGILFVTDTKEDLASAINALRLPIDISVTGDIASTVSLSTPS